MLKMDSIKIREFGGFEMRDISKGTENDNGKECENVS
jgi:hypothetical protein